MFLSSTYYSIWLFISLFIGVCVGESGDNTALIRQRSHIKSLFVSILHQTGNLMYSKHIRIISCVGIEPFLLVINLDVVSSYNIFTSLIFVLRRKDVVLNK